MWRIDCTGARERELGQRLGVAREADRPLGGPAEPHGVRLSVIALPAHGKKFIGTMFLLRGGGRFSSFELLVKLRFLSVLVQKLHQISRSRAGTQNEAKKPANMSRNRYRDVLPSELASN